MAKAVRKQIKKNREEHGSSGHTDEGHKEAKKDTAALTDALEGFDSNEDSDEVAERADAPLDEIDAPFEGDQIQFDPAEIQSETTAATNAITDEVKEDYREEVNSDT